jgi:hypothetical protein
MPEKVYYNRNGILITSARAIFLAGTEHQRGYAMVDITSFRVNSIKQDLAIPILMFLSGFVLAFFCGGGIFSGCCGVGKLIGSEDGQRAFSIITFCLGIIVALGGLRFMRKPSYTVVICTAEGAHEAYVTADQAESEDIIASLNLAFKAQELPKESSPPVVREIERIVERQVLVIRCRFCGNLTAADLSQCQSCGGKQ